MRIYLHFVGADSISLAGIEEVLQQLRAYLIAREIGDLKLMRNQIPEIPSNVIRQVVKELEQHTRDPIIFKLSAVEKGSLGFFVGVTALAYWLLDKTLGETVKDAWKATQLHDRIRAYFLRGRKDKLRALQRDVNSTIERPDPRRARHSSEIEVPMRAEIDENFTEISIRIEYSSLSKVAREIPTYDELASYED
jgi:hypothetical protein